jgi:hypothetical protein
MGGCRLARLFFPWNMWQSTGFMHVLCNNLRTNRLIAFTSQHKL